MKPHTKTIIKSFLIFLALSATPLTALARDSLEALRNDLNITNTAVTSLQAQVNTLSPPVIYTIGDTGPAGGIVFSVTADGLHGLEAAPSDQGVDIKWSNGSEIVTGAVWAGINGWRNTDRIISSQGAGNYAAFLCANYTGGGYGDWYLPSKYELNLLYQQRNVVGITYPGGYWSSTEDSYGLAWAQNFNNVGYQHTQNKFHPIYHVRAVRAF